MTSAMAQDAMTQSASQTRSLDDRDWQLPEHSIEELAPKAKEFCIAIPVLNEGERLSRQLARMQRFCDECDILVADGNSTDGCTAADRMRPFGVRTVLRKLGPPGGLSTNMRMAYAYALRQGYLGIIQIDGNDKDGVEAIPEYVRRLRRGVDCVLGSRYLPGGLAVNTPWSRDIAIRLVHAPLISFAAGKRMTDTTNSFRGFSRRYLLDPRVRPFRHAFANYNLPYYLAVRAAQLGYHVEDVPVVRAYPKGGPAPTKIRGLKGYFGIMIELLNTLIGTYNPRR
jgi:dolichol-phosphate mannosyltransferase